MSEDKKTKVSRKAILPFVVKMDEPIKTINEVIASMPESGAKESFTISITALKKKFDKYSAAVVVVQGEVLSDEEKEMLVEFRKNKASEKPLEQTEESQIPPAEEPIKKKRSKKEQ